MNFEVKIWIGRKKAVSVLDRKHYFVSPHAFITVEPRTHNDNSITRDINNNAGWIITSHD